MSPTSYLTAPPRDLKASLVFYRSFVNLSFPEHCQRESPTIFVDESSQLCYKLTLHVLQDGEV
jgi:hypothetical protein